MKLLLKIISPIIASVLGVLLTNSFNLFDVIPFVPKEESFGLCIMVYFPIIDVIFNFIFEQFYKSLVDKFTSRLTATITSYNTNVRFVAVENIENIFTYVFKEFYKFFSEKIRDYLVCLIKNSR